MTYVSVSPTNGEVENYWVCCIYQVWSYLKKRNSCCCVWMSPIWVILHILIYIKYKWPNVKFHALVSTEFVCILNNYYTDRVPLKHTSFSFCAWKRMVIVRWVSRICVQHSKIVVLLKLCIVCQWKYCCEFHISYICGLRFHQFNIHKVNHIWLGHLMSQLYTYVWLLITVKRKYLILGLLYRTYSNL